MRHFLLILVAGLLCFAMTSETAFADGGGRIGGSGFGTTTFEYDDSEDEEEAEEDLYLDRVLNRIRLTYTDGSTAQITRIPVAFTGYTDFAVQVSTREVQVTENFGKGIGIDLGYDLDDERYDEVNRVGNAYRVDDDSLFLALNSSVMWDPEARDLGISRISFVNQDNLYELDMPDSPQFLSRRELNITLGELGQLGAIRTLTAPRANPDDSVVTARLDVKEVEDDFGDRGVPFLNEVPTLRAHFAGTVHQNEERDLVVFIRPTIEF